MVDKPRTMTPQPDLSISLVSLNRPDLAHQCLTALEENTTAIAYQVHLVAHEYDPFALSELIARHPHVIVHQVSGTRGYSQNNNVAIRAARGRFVAILNDDTVVGNDLFGTLVRFLDEHPDVVAVCPVLRNPDGSLQMGFRGRFTPLSFVASELRIDRLLPRQWAVRLGAFDRPWLPVDRGNAMDIEAGTGACFVARKKALEAIGFLDEDYFLGPDDIDWTVRLRKRAGRVVLLPNANLIHLRGATLGSNYDAVVPAVYAGSYTFFRRHHSRLAEWSVRIGLGFVWSALLTLGWAILGAISHSRRASMMRRARWNCVRFAFSMEPSPSVFARVRSGRD